MINNSLILSEKPGKIYVDIYLFCDSPAVSFSEKQKQQISKLFLQKHLTFEFYCKKNQLGKFLVISIILLLLFTCSL